MRHKKNAVYLRNGSDFARHEPRRASRSARCAAAVAGSVRAIARVRQKDRSAMGGRWGQSSRSRCDPRPAHDGATGINGVGRVQGAQQSRTASQILTWPCKSVILLCQVKALIAIVACVRGPDGTSTRDEPRAVLKSRDVGDGRIAPKIRGTSQRNRASPAVGVHAEPSTPTQLSQL